MSIRLFGSRADVPLLGCRLFVLLLLCLPRREVLLLMAIGGRQAQPEDRTGKESGARKRETANGSESERDEIRIVVVFVCDRLFVLWMRPRFCCCCSCMWIFLWVDIEIEIFSSSFLRPHVFVFVSSLFSKWSNVLLPSADGLPHHSLLPLKCMCVFVCVCVADGMQLQMQ